MKTIKKNGLTIKQLEERYEMTVASSDSKGCLCDCDCKTGKPFGTELLQN